ncbi:reverse transcriptase domain-containing protein [Tanacetum coccineum]
MLNVRKGCQPVRQKKKGQAAERNIAINDEVSKLVTVGIMREVHYHYWISNPVMVKKSDNSWRMCVDFKDLNKACPKDGYPLPEIDWKVESLCGFPFKCFLDAYNGYHQIKMAEEDEEKTAFITNQGIFCYTKMPFGLRNAEEAEAAFRQMKEHIAKLPMLTAPEEQEELIVYLAASKEEGQCTVTNRRKGEAKQMPIYISCRASNGPEVNYTPWKKSTTNNEGKYEALIARIADSENSRQSLQCNVDSKLVANQVNGSYIAKETDMIKYLEKVKALATERKNARAIKRKSQRFAIIKRILYKKSFLGPWLRCVGPSQANYVLREIHEGTRSVVAKALRIGYYWPTMHKDAKALIKACQECQVILRIISDNGKQFRDNPFKDWCEKLCIQQHFASVKHPQTNGLVERANRSLGEGIKARLGKDNKNWMEEISHVLWAHRTMVKSSNGDTPFSLTYGTEAVIPAEIRMPTFRTAELDMTKNDEALQINLELLEERREQAAITEAKSKRQMEKYYNAKVRNTSFKPGDLVYRNNEASRAEDTGKLGPKWEGPYEVTEALGKGSYRLKDRNGNELPQTWNVSNLKKCYVYKM